jgi:hypothetical protein
MKLKQDATLDVVCEKLRKEISTHITVKIKTHPIYRNRWIEVNKDSFVGVKIFHKDNDLLIDGHIPSFFARAFFGSLISSLFHYRARKNFKQKITDFLISEFLEQSN